MATQAPVRSLVLWFPDWPVIALVREGVRDAAGEPCDASAPIAVVEKNLVSACSAAARAEGVRRGQRRRDAQARCPDLAIVPGDAGRDRRVFAPVVSAVEEHAPGVQLVRPGLCALRARGPARYYGGEVEVARVLLGALHDLGLDGVGAGIADGLFTAEQAARAAVRSVARSADPVCVVPPGDAAAFLAPLSIAVLGTSEGADVVGVGASRASRGAASADDLVGLLARLGVQTLGEFAAMDPKRVHERFGPPGMRLHALAAGLDSRPIDPSIPPPELHREVAFEPPLELADQVAFGMRVAADEFIARLGAAGLVCTELRVELEGEHAERSERVWLHPGSFDAAGVVDRVRWQLGEDAESLRGGVAVVRISPERVDAASHHAKALFGSGPDERVHHALSRVQAMLGHRGVLIAAIGGGRRLAERQVLVPWGDRATSAEDSARPWPGSLPAPVPATVYREQPPVEVTSADGATVVVGERDALSAPPAQLVEGGRRRAIEAWAGPWPVVEREWDAARRRRAHRFQVVDADGAAWLLVCEDGGWVAEGRYD